MLPADQVRRGHSAEREGFGLLEPLQVMPRFHSRCLLSLATFAVAGYVSLASPLT